MNKNQRFSVIFLFLIFFLMKGSIQSYALGLVEFGPKETQIKGSIKYSVIGRYNAQFSSFQGKITIDERSNFIQSVDLEIEAASIKSDCQWCDKIVRSEQLLATDKFSKIIFMSDEIIKNELDYTVKGVLEMHGVKRRVSFPFQAQILNNKDSTQKTLDIKGRWQINRKNFKIVWNKVLDQGGVLVGNFITVDWGIKAELEE